MEENNQINIRKTSDNNDINLVTLNKVKKIQSLLKKESALKGLCKFISYYLFFIFFSYKDRKKYNK